MALSNPNRFYVYLHKRKDTGEVFYVGKGQGARHSAKAARNSAWASVVEKAGGFESEIIKSNLSNATALILEAELISKYCDLTNKRKSQTETLEMSFDLFNEWFYYDETSPSCLRRKKVLPNSGRQSIGSPAGSCTKTWTVRLHGKLYLGSRIVYLLTNGSIDKNFIIDHIDTNRKNNNKNNLQQISASENARLKKCKDINFACLGYAQQGTQSRYVVQWTDLSGKRMRKYFCISKNQDKETAFSLAKIYRDNLIFQKLILMREV